MSTSTTDNTGAGGAPRDPAWDLIPAYALDAVDDLERRAVERLVASDDAARRALASYRETAAAMVPDLEPPASLRADVLAGLDGVPAADVSGGRPDEAAVEPADETSGNVVPIDRARRRWPVVAVAAAALVAIAVPTTVAVDQHQKNVQLQAQANEVASILGDPNAKVVTGPVAGGGSTSVLVSGEQALFTATNMPATPSGKTYQLWVVADGKATSAGTMGSGSTRVLVDAKPGDTVAVTVEPDGGSKQPTTKPIAALTT